MVLEKSVMNRNELIEAIFSSLDEKHFTSIRNTLFNRYIPFSFFKKDDITCQVIMEKTNDYFGTVEALTGRSFDSIVDIYASELEEIVGNKIVKYTGPKKDAPKTRAMKYYERALAIKKKGFSTITQITDYYRIMLCLYMAIIKNKHKYISDFDFSSECLEGKLIMAALRNEEISTFMGTRKRFNDRGRYSKDRSTLIMIVLMYYFIKNKEVEDEF